MFCKNETLKDFHVPSPKSKYRREKIVLLSVIFSKKNTKNSKTRTNWIDLIQQHRVYVILRFKVEQKMQNNIF